MLDLRDASPRVNLGRIIRDEFQRNDLSLKRSNRIKFKREIRMSKALITREIHVHDGQKFRAERYRGAKPRFADRDEASIENVSLSRLKHSFRLRNARQSCASMEKPRETVRVSLPSGK